MIKAIASFGTAPSGRARYVILLSDGGDTASTATLDQALTAVRSSGIPVYVIGLKSTEFDSGPLVGVVDASGSRYLETPDPGALGSLYEALAKEIHNQYLLTFTLARVVPWLPATSRCRSRLGARRRRPNRASSIRPLTTLGTTTTTLVSSVTVPAVTEVAGSGSCRPVPSLEGSDWIIGVVVFLLVLAMLWVLSGVLFPKRDVLAEYSGAMDRQAALNPQAVDEQAAKPGALSRATSRMLAIRGYQDPLQQMIDDASLEVAGLRVRSPAAW